MTRSRRAALACGASRRAQVCALFAIACGAASCSSPAPSMVVGITTQMRVPKDLRSVRVVARVGGASTCQTYAIDTTPIALPISTTLEGNANDVVKVTVAGFSGASTSLPSDPCAIDGALVVKSATTHLIDGQLLYLPMALKYLCEGVTCDDGQTCFAGACDDDAVDPGTLVRYSDPLLYGNTSFCISNGTCMNHTSPVLMSDPDHCTFTFAIDDVAFDNQGVNIQLIHDNLEREVIDLDDPREGFSYDPKTTKQFTIAPRLCDDVKSGKITVVSSGVGCPAKTVLNPMCDPAHDGDNGRPREAAGTCTSSVNVQPSPNAYYFLLDRSSSMGAFYTQAQGTFSEILRLLLSAPLFSTASVALGYLPASAADCTAGSSSLGSPLVPMGMANQSADAIAEALDPSAVLPSDPPLFVDAALRSATAYSVLEALDPAAFDKRDLVLVGNRDFFGDCDPSIGTTSDAAFQEHLQGIETGVLVLKAPPTADQGAHDPVVDGLAIARVGLGPYADGTVSDTQAAIAVLSGFDVKQSCTYDIPAGADLQNVPGSFLTYFDVVAQNRIDIPLNAGCVDAISPVDGFNVVGSKILVCGAPCAGLRFVLDTAGLYAIQHHAQPPLVPIRWSPPCE
ncbi:MAG: hypothetical protein ACRELY_09435 [Polyangiaceae bacterium]